MNIEEYKKLTQKSSVPKYRNKKITIDGMTFDSTGEYVRYGELSLLEQAGEIKNLQRQVRIPCIINGTKVFTYVADFVYLDTKTNQQTVEDFKGFETDIFKLKKKILEAQGISITIVKKSKKKR